jgi:Spy/CpxP family protein refolding chaperone
MRFLRALNLTDDQKKAFRDARDAAEPTRDAARERARAAVKAAFEDARKSVEPTATRLVAMLSAEQKQKIVEAAAKRGKTVDDARLVAIVERMLLARGRRGR